MKIDKRNHLAGYLDVLVAVNICPPGVTGYYAQIHYIYDKICQRIDQGFMFPGLVELRDELKRRIDEGDHDVMFVASEFSY